MKNKKEKIRSKQRRKIKYKENAKQEKSRKLKNTNSTFKEIREIKKIRRKKCEK